MAGLEMVASATLPTRFGKFTIYAFKSRGEEHVALVKGDVRGRAGVLTRVHSQCLTGDTFASLRCDCREQLERAMRLIGRSRYGVLIYLSQEGRGIGLANKIRAYALQERGFDTVEANRALGFEPDTRSYATAGQILRLLGVRSVALLTNNPKKVGELRESGIRVAKRIPLQVRPTRFNASYLLAKKHKLHHLIELGENVCRR
ncbi:MAG: GTP cyclohydrolase II [Candidatus Micrarchaeia archaeon]